MAACVQPAARSGCWSLPAQTAHVSDAKGEWALAASVLQCPLSAVSHAGLVCSSEPAPVSSRSSSRASRAAAIPLERYPCPPGPHPHPAQSGKFDPHPTHDHAHG